MGTLIECCIIIILMCGYLYLSFFIGKEEQIHWIVRAIIWCLLAFGTIYLWCFFFHPNLLR